MTVEFSNKEVKRISDILLEQYKKSVSLLEMVELKTILGKLKTVVDDGLPNLQSIT